jgi:hypothetical protein
MPVCVIDNNQLTKPHSGWRNIIAKPSTRHDTPEYRRRDWHACLLRKIVGLKSNAQFTVTESMQYSGQWGLAAGAGHVIGE